MSSRPMRLRALAVLASLALSGVPAPLPAAAAEDFAATAKAFKDEVGAEKGDVRMRAFEKVAKSTDPRAVDLILEGVSRETVRLDGLLKMQDKRGVELEKALGDIEKGNATVPKTPKEVDAYNKRMTKLMQARDDLGERLKVIGADLVEERAILANASAAMGAVVTSIPAPEAVKALAKIEAAWRGPKSLPEEQLRWVDVMVRVRLPEAGDRLTEATRDEALDPRVRASAIEAKVTRGDPGALEIAASALSSTSFPVQAAAVESLRRLHVKEAIEPLIGQLVREDLGEMRTRVHRALKSLTGEKHGPYAQPWRDWWTGAKATFVMPDKAAPVDELSTPEKGLTFYGITTFSDRILFVLDVSGSMLDPAHPDAGGARGAERKIDVLRKELAGAIDMLDEKKVFNVLLFNHRVFRFQDGAIKGDAANREAAKKWALAVEPSSGTNIHDSLEQGFRLATTSPEGKGYQTVFDTIFFMTDGTPTAGKLQKPGPILEAVAEWNRAARLTVHCIAVGQWADEEFLKKLSAAHSGSYVKR